MSSSAQSGKECMKTDVSAYLKFYLASWLLHTRVKMTKNRNALTTPSYEVLRLHRLTLNQTGSDEREKYITVSDTYANID